MGNLVVVDIIDISKLMTVNEVEVVRLDFIVRGIEVMGRINKEWYFERNSKYFFKGKCVLNYMCSKCVYIYLYDCDILIRYFI